MVNWSPSRNVEHAVNSSGHEFSVGDYAQNDSFYGEICRMWNYDGRIVAAILRNCRRKSNDRLSGENDGIYCGTCIGRGSSRCRNIRAVSIEEIEPYYIGCKECMKCVNSCKMDKPCPFYQKRYD
jgi:hypothetical protein